MTDVAECFCLIRKRRILFFYRILVDAYIEEERI